MSWSFSQEWEEEYLGIDSLTGELSAPSRSRNTTEESSCSGKMTECLNPSLSGMMYGPSMESRGVAGFILSLEGSPVSPSLLLDDSTVRVIRGIYGLTQSALYGTLDPISHSLKMSLASLVLNTSVKSVKIFPPSGTLLDGQLFLQANSARRISVIGCGYSLPTPTASDWKRGGNDKFSTLPGRLGGRPNLRFAEWMMGWPIGWSNPEPLGMDKLQEWLLLHGVD
jgi:hypothetical protein